MSAQETSCRNCEHHRALLLAGQDREQRQRDEIARLEAELETWLSAWRKATEPRPVEQAEEPRRVTWYGGAA